MHTLPTQLTQFVGRAEEITELQNMLSNPDCRLLTVVGVGGIGKTRLALQTAAQMADDFADGVYFVPLQPVDSIQFFALAVGDAIGLKPASNEDPTLQLLNHLHPREMLLIIDNFEQLIAHAGVLTEVLEAAPDVKLLVTSRDILRLQEEWVYPLQGLAYPKPGIAETGTVGANGELTAYSAVQLFVERARRVRRGFTLEAEAAGILDICQLVEGMPLALELAAVWTQSLSAAAIAKEIRNNLDFLAVDWRNVPDRQRSMRAVFDHAYRQLTANEQQVFMRLAVFRGGFHRRAAEYVTGASLATLGSLVSHCLLHWEPVGRYQVHELLRQYADELLRAAPENKAAIEDRHCAYFADFLFARMPNFTGKDQWQAVHAIDDEIENILAAWQHAVATRNVDALGKAVQAFTLYFEYRSRYLDEVKLLEAAIEKLHIFESDDPEIMLLAIRFMETAWYYVRMGRFDEADAIQKRIQYCYDQLGIPPIEGAATDPQIIASILATIRGEYDEALRLGQAALEKTKLNNHLVNRQYTLYALASASLAQGDFQTAKEYAAAALVITQETGDDWFRAYCLLELGNVASAMHDYATARQHLEASYAIRQEFNDAEGMAVSLAHLGDVALQQGQLQEARSYFERSVALYQEISDHGGLARALDGLGNTHCALHDYATARHHLARALKLAGEIQFVTLMCTIITSIANLLLLNGNTASALMLLTQIEEHPSSTTTCKARARQLLDQHRAIVDTPHVEAAPAQTPPQTPTETLNALAEMAQRELARIEVTPPAAPQNAAPQPAPNTASTPASNTGHDTASQPLVDPLTARELEILNLIVEGLSNQQIASELYITRGTVKWYTSQIYSKLGINSRTKAIGRARELSLTS